MYIIPESLTADIQYNQRLIEQFKQGEISGAQLKSNRVPMGIYEQREDGHYMLRIRCTGGLITPRQLRRVAEVGAKVNCSHIHITTRQEVQIHNVNIDDATPALLLLKEEGLATQGGGGNTVRNMLVNEWGGISDRQTFDPYPYAIGLTTRLIAEKDSWSMPRKLKIAFDMNEEDANFSLVADLGLIPVIQDGKRGFKVFLGGSVASNPHKGWQVFDFLPEKDLFRAAVTSFIRTARRKPSDCTSRNITNSPKMRRSTSSLPCCHSNIRRRRLRRSKMIAMISSSGKSVTLSIRPSARGFLSSSPSYMEMPHLRCLER